MKDKVQLALWTAMVCVIIAIGIIIGSLCNKSDKYDALIDEIAFSRCLHIDLSNYTTGYWYDEEQKMWIFTAENEYKKITVGYENKETLKAVVTNTYCK